MQTPHRWFGAGHSTAADSATAGAEAAASAFGGRTPAVVFVFCSVRHDLAALLLAVRVEAGENATVVGATTLGELAYDGAGVGGVAVSALGGEGFTVHTAVGHVRDAGPREAGAVAAGAMAGVSSPHSVLVMLCEGRSGDRHEVVRGAYSVLGAAVPVVGGFAGHDDAEQRTYQFHDDTIFSDAVIGVALGSDAPIGIGVAHGWHRVDPPMVVSRSSGDRIYEIDDEPARDVLRRRTGRAGSDQTYALGVSRRSGEDVRLIRAGDEEDRSVRAPAEVPQGALVWLMDGDHDAIVDGATSSCAEAVDGLHGRTPLGVLAFDCAERRARLGPDGLRDEMAAIRTVLGGAPYAGFYSSGEIARVRGAQGTHALTLVTLALA